DTFQALRCIGYLVVGHRQNLVAFASEVLWEKQKVEPSLNSILHILLRGSTAQEFVAVDIVFRFFCEWNEYSIESLMERLPDHPHLPTPRRGVISPMVKHKFGNLKRIKRKWSPQDEQALRYVV
ncbi:hypothetical protein MKX03_037028, partial [Papaver bracteatum]